MRIFEITLFGATFGPTWYGLMYALAFGAAWGLLTWRGPFSKRQLDELVFWGLVGVVVGGRLGYVLIYNLPYFSANPAEILMPWKGGMSFHGGLMGVIAVMWIFARKEKMPFWKVADCAAWVTPLGIMFGRIGNYINGELLGWKGYAGPLAVVRDGVSYFPTPLLEAGLEGALLFAATSWAYFRWAYACHPEAALCHPEGVRLGGRLEGSRGASTRICGGILRLVRRCGLAQNDAAGRVALLFLAGYAVARFVAEFFRDPDPQVGYLLWGWVTAGQGFSAAMALAAIIIYVSKSKAHGK